MRWVKRTQQMPLHLISLAEYSPHLHHPVAPQTDHYNLHLFILCGAYTDYTR